MDCDYWHHALRCAVLGRSTLMDWLKANWTSFLVAIGMFFAAMAVAKAGREKASANKWKERAVADAEADVEENIVSAKAALSQAKLHDAKAREAKEKARKRLDKIGERDEDMATIVSGWRSARLRSDSDT